MHNKIDSIALHKTILMNTLKNLISSRFIGFVYWNSLIYRSTEAKLLKKLTEKEAELAELLQEGFFLWILMCFKVI